MKLLLACAGPRSDASAVRTAAEAVADWNTEFALASAHRLAPVVYWRLRDSAADVVPPAALTAFATSFHATARSNLLMAAELGRVTAWFHASNVPVLAFKGPALAALLYPNFGLRPCCDLDLLVPAARRAVATEVLSCKCRRPQGAAGADRLRSEIGASFVTPNGCKLDLHWAVSPRYFLRFDERSAWERTRTVDVAGFPIRTFGSEDLLACLALHGARHCWECLGWISDIAHLLAAGPLDWEFILANARQRRAITVAVLLACELFREPLPPSLRPDRVACSLAAGIGGRVRASAANMAGTIQAARLHLQFASHWEDKLRYVWRRILEPTQTDADFAPLPAFLHPALYAVRPLRLTLKCGTLAARRLLS